MSKTSLSSTIPSVTGLTIESLYNNYVSEKYKVNRRYQRKLVWTIEEKEALVDSILNRYPIPLFLYADIKTSARRYYEIIDGMQRMNAIIYFLENKISHQGRYFDLDILAAAKAKKDDQQLQQQEPRYDRDTCLSFIQYIVPSTIYEFEKSDEIDQVFKRINSKGRHLSRQELRVAGAVGELPTLVRKISADLRGDSSQSDVFALSKMPYISLAFGDLEPGIKVSDVLWIKHGIITKDMLRESRDEEIVCDIVASVAMEDLPASNTDLFNAMYGYPNASSRTSEIAAAVSRTGANALESNINLAFDNFLSLFNRIDSTFSVYCFSNPSARVPRYFTAFLIALYTLKFKKKRKLTNFSGLRRALKNVCDNLDVGTGGNWSSTSKERCINSLVGIMDPYCEDISGSDPMAADWAIRIENLLHQSSIEQQLYDFKIGLTDLVNEPNFNRGLISQIIKTLVAMGNSGQGCCGYVLIGIADSKRDAQRVKELFGVESKQVENHYVIGVDYNCDVLNITIDQLFSKLCQIIDNEPIDADVIKEIKTNAKIVNYYGKSVIILNLRAGNSPRMYKEGYWIREGTSTRELQISEMQWLFDQFKN